MSISFFYKDPSSTTYLPFEQRFPLLIRILSPHGLHTFSLNNFELFKLVPIVLRLFDPLIYSNQLFGVLHILQGDVWLNLRSLDGPVKLYI